MLGRIVGSEASDLPALFNLLVSSPFDGQDISHLSLATKNPYN
jgi:hypothetical protein